MAKFVLDIIEENDHFVAINKPAGMLSIPDREGKEISLKQILREKYGNIFVVHRLDRDTSGVIIFARNEEAHQFLSIAFEDRTVEKFYQGIVTGTLPYNEGTIDQPIAESTTKRGEMLIHKRGKQSITDYKVEEAFGKYTLVRFQIHTGRTHQIRVHMQFLGNPLACDPVYGDGKPVLISAIKKDYKLSKNELDEKPILSRVALHAAELRFTSPNGTKYVLQAEIPKDMRALLQQLRKRVKN